MAEQAVPWDSLVPAVVRWRGASEGGASTSEPNDYNSTDQTYGTEHNNENCAKFQGGLAVDYACSSILPFSPTAYVCGKSRCESDAISAWAPFFFGCALISWGLC
jgi:hypothetical protein